MKTLNFTRKIPDDLYEIITKMPQLSDMLPEDYYWLMLLMSVEADIHDMLELSDKGKRFSTLVRSHIDAFWAEMEKMELVSV